MLEDSPEEPGSAAVNAAQVRCGGLEDANRVLRAQLAAVTPFVELSRAAPLVSPSLPLPCGPAADIRHPLCFGALLRVMTFCRHIPLKNGTEPGGPSLTRLGPISGLLAMLPSTFPCVIVALPQRT